LWERVNAVDSNGYLVAMILGPPIAAGLVAFIGAPGALLVIGVAFGGAALALIGVNDPETESESTDNLLADAWAGVLYVARNPTLRGLGLAISLVNVAGGMVSIVLPLIVLDRLGQGEALVGLIFALTGVSGMAAAFAFGRMDTRGREWALLVWPMLLSVPTMALLLPAAMASAVGLGIALLCVHSLVMGALYGPSDIALFTVRQRRTDPAWMGRAFAVSMAINYMGVPIGAGLAGLLASYSIELAIVVLGVGGTLAATASAAFLIPRYAPDADAADARA
jgi:predicted MFS family arabinose efflux permease